MNGLPPATKTLRCAASILFISLWASEGTHHQLLLYRFRHPPLIGRLYELVDDVGDTLGSRDDASADEFFPKSHHALLIIPATLPARAGNSRA